jgi:hypothetical protein
MRWSFTTWILGGIVTLEAPQIPRLKEAAMSSGQREPVSFITVESGGDLIVAYAIQLEKPGDVVSLILHRPKYEFLLPLEEQSVVVSHELFPEEDRDLAKRVVVDGPNIEIESTARTYRLDLSVVDPEEVEDAREMLQRMHGSGGFDLPLR